MIKIKNSAILYTIAFMALFLPAVVLAASMSSENYSVSSGVIGPGVVTDSVSANYKLEYSPGEESRIVTAVCEDNFDNDGDGLIDYPSDPGCSSPSDNDETDPIVPSGVGLVGIFSTVIPAHLEAFNMPLTILPTQSGTLRQNTSSGEVLLGVPKGSATSKITFTIIEEPLASANSWMVAQGSGLINSVFYNVGAKDQNGNPVTSFPNYITITLPIPKLLVDTDSLGVYWFKEAAGEWVLIPDAIFNKAAGKVSFRVNHLTEFAVFKTIEQPETLRALSQKKGVFETVGDFLNGLVSPALKNEKGATGSVKTVEGAEISNPQGPLNISLEIGNPSVAISGELSAHVLFSNVSGKSSVPVDLSFTILDKKGRTLYAEKDNIIVGKKKVLIKKFENLNLSPGKYVFVLTTLYDNNIKNEFRRDFEVTERGAGQPLYLFSLVLLSVIVIYLMYLGRKRRRKQKTNESLYSI